MTSASPADAGVTFGATFLTLSAKLEKSAQFSVTFGIRRAGSAEKGVPDDLFMGTLGAYKLSPWAPWGL